jgi:outer membrane protein OmpA-like peptidoglycan-associated protein
MRRTPGSPPVAPGAHPPPAAQQRAPGAPPQAQGGHGQPAGRAGQGQPLRPVPLQGSAAPHPVDSSGRALRRVDDIRAQRREQVVNGRTIIREPDREIIREGKHTIIRHNDADRFRYNARKVDVQRRGNNTVTVIERPDGSRIITESDADGRLLRRSRRFHDGREVVIIDNPPRRLPPGVAVGAAIGAAVGIGAYFVDLPPPVVRIPRDRYILESERARPEDFYTVLSEPPVEPIQRRYSLDEVRYSQAVRERMPRVDIDTINFETGSWEVAPDQAARLAAMADGIKRIIAANPAEAFLIEGHTDAVGSDVDNLSLSDRRAESVAVILTDQFQVPPENLVTQGYGEQFLKVPSQGPERRNRRVTVRRITPLLMGQK